MGAVCRAPAMQKGFLILCSVTVWAALSRAQELDSGFPSSVGCAEGDDECELNTILEGGEIRLPAPSSKVQAYLNAVQTVVNSLPYQEGMTVFSPEWKESTESLNAILVDMPAVNGEVAENNLANFKALAQSMLASLDDEGKIKLVKSCLLTAIDTRPDTTGMNMEDYKIFPELDDTVNRLTGGEDYRGEAWSSLSNATAFSRVSEEESPLNYFREDSSLHIFHNRWHGTHRSSGSTRDPRNRKNERFFYMHRQLLFRYMIERRVANMPELVPLDARREKREFSSRYHMDFNNDPKRKLVGYARNKDTCKLSPDAQSILNRWERNCINSLRTEGMASADCEGNYHNVGHSSIMLNENCAEIWPCTSRHCRVESKFGVMSDPAAAARDPVFYRWHLEVDRKYDIYLESLPLYELREVKPPKGIILADIMLKSRCARPNVVETYWDAYEDNKFRLNHQAFTVNIRLNNPQHFAGKVIVRLFLVLEEFVDSMRFPIELDQFVVKLSGQTTETVSRLSSESSLTDKRGPRRNDQCGWPSHLQLPKGKHDGPTIFRLIAMVNEPTSQDVTVGMDQRGAHILCGSNHNHNIIHDKNELGFPLNRPWNFNRAQVINNNHRDFGRVSTKIEIFHVGIPTKECMV